MNLGKLPFDFAQPALEVPDINRNITNLVLNPDQIRMTGHIVIHGLADRLELTVLVIKARSKTILNTIDPIIQPGFDTLDLSTEPRLHAADVPPEVLYRNLFWSLVGCSAVISQKVISQSSISKRSF